MKEKKQDEISIRWSHWQTTLRFIHTVLTFRSLYSAVAFGNRRFVRRQKPRPPIRVIIGYCNLEPYRKQYGAGNAVNAAVSTRIEFQSLKEH